MPEILRQMVDIKLFDQALLSSTQTPAYAVCKSEFNYCSDRHVYYAYSGKVNAEESALDMRLACEDDLEKLNNIYFRINFSSRKKDVWADKIKLGEVYLYRKDNEIIAVGACSADDMQPEVVKVDVWVAKEYRHQGLGTRILPFLVDKAIEQGKCPIINAEATYYIDAVKKLAEKCGFECRAMIVEMRL